MAHLIQPLDVDGTVYCVAYQGNRATQIVNSEVVSTPTDLATITDPEGPWETQIAGIASQFEVSMGVGCGDSVNTYHEVTTTSAGWEVVISAHVNGNLTAAATLTMSDSTVSSGNLNFSISDVPCGSVITFVTSIIEDEGDLTLVTSSITSIT